MSDDLELLRLVKRIRKFIEESDDLDNDSTVAELLEAIEDAALVDEDE